MRKILFASAAAVALVASASATGTASLNVTATIDNFCTVAAGPNIALGNVNPGATAIGNSSFTVTCNFSGNATGTLASTFGGLTANAGVSTLPYTLNSVDFGTTSSAAIGGAGVPLSGTVTTGTNLRAFDVSFTAPAGTLAGNYTDTLTVTVSP